MRGSLLAVLALVSATLAGCVGLPLDSASTLPVDLALPNPPAGATVSQIENGLRLAFANVALPFEETIPIPAGTTIVTATAEVASDLGVGVSMRHAETERRRCNLAPLDAWDRPLLGRAQCSGVTAVDALPSEWIVRATSAGATEAKLVTIDLLTTPYDGLLAELDLTQLSQRAFELEETESMMVPSFDGTNLYVEVTLPTGEGPWPTILWSSPYNQADHDAGLPSAWKYFVRDWAERGYAVVSADVRGYGLSEGCVEVWSENEQKDQSFLVDWVASQEWSDGNVGFYGQSYVATTPVEAAVQAPEALKAIVIVAPVNNAYDDWHFGGVPNGENSLSPVSYQTLGGGIPLGVPDPTSLPYLATRADNGLCDPTLTARASDPRAVYDAFYAERNFSARAAEIKAAVLYTQGFEDSNVKSQMIPDFFNAITAPKLGLFGHWVHQHPTRADNEALFLGWMDQYVKGKPLGFEKLPSVDVVTNVGTRRASDAWPTPGAATTLLYPDFAGGALAQAPADGSAMLLLDPAGDPTTATLPVEDSLSEPLALPLALPPDPLGVTGPSLLTLASAPLADPVHLAGQGVVRVVGTLERAENAHVAAYLYEDSESGSSLVTWGMFNLAHRFGHDAYEPVQPGETFTIGLPLLPTEWVFAAGTTLRLEIRGVTATDWSATTPTEPGTLTLAGGADGTTLALPTADAATVAPLPATSVR